MDPFAPKRHCYLLRLEFLGFRYHGWQKQPGVKTIQEMLDKTIRFVVGKEVKFKTLGASRTDAMVSARDFPCELFIEQELDDNFLIDLNFNLPGDIQVLTMEVVSPEFNVIQDVVTKEYHYNFTFGKCKKPFSSHQSAHFIKSLDAELIKQGAREFVGTHNFKAYSYPILDKDQKRTIVDCTLDHNEDNEQFTLKVIGQGFMRYQIRIMTGALIELGESVINLEDLIKSLQPGFGGKIGFKAPASGLTLHKVSYS